MVRALGAYLIGNLAEPLLRLGRWAEVDRLLAQALSTVPEGIFAASVLQLRAERAAMSGRYADAEADLRTARGALAGTTDMQFVLPLGYVTAVAALGRGDLAAARAAVAGCLPDEPFVWGARYSWPLLWLGIRIEADEAVRARDRRDAVPEQSAARHQVLAAGMAVCPPPPRPPGGTGPCSRRSRAGSSVTTTRGSGRRRSPRGKRRRSHTLWPTPGCGAPNRSPRPATGRPPPAPCGRLMRWRAGSGPTRSRPRRRHWPAGPGWIWTAAGRPRRERRVANPGPWMPAPLVHAA